MIMTIILLVIYFMILGRMKRAIQVKRDYEKILQDYENTCNLQKINKSIYPNFETDYKLHHVHIFEHI